MSNKSLSPQEDMPERQSQAQLAAKLANAATQVKVGGRYMHYKQLCYKVLAVGLREDDINNGACVIYQAQYGERIIWIRPVASWIEEITVKGQSIKRFTEISNDD